MGPRGRPRRGRVDLAECQPAGLRRAGQTWLLGSPGTQLKWESLPGSASGVKKAKQKYTQPLAPHFLTWGPRTSLWLCFSKSVQAAQHPRADGGRPSSEGATPTPALAQGSYVLPPRRPGGSLPPAPHPLTGCGARLTLSLPRKAPQPPHVPGLPCPGVPAPQCNLPRTVESAPRDGVLLWGRMPYPWVSSIQNAPGPQ